MISLQQVMGSTRSKDYGSKGPVNNGSDANSSGQIFGSIRPPPSEPLHIDKLNPDMMIRPPPKGVL